jgi:hypothetical protein
VLENNKENICTDTDQEKSKRAISDEREEMSFTGLEQRDLLREEVLVNQ